MRAGQGGASLDQPRYVILQIFGRDRTSQSLQRVTILSVSVCPTILAKFRALVTCMVIVCVVLPSGLRAQDASVPVVGRAAQADAVYRQGIASLQQGDLASARTAFEKAVQLSPRSPEGHNSLGWVYLAQHQVDLAIAQFQAALDLRVDFFQAHMNLSTAFLLKGDPKRAVREGREAVRFAPTESEAYRALARALDASGDAAGAVKQIRRAVELDPGRPELHDELGTLLVRQSTMPAGPASDETAQPGATPGKDPSGAS